MKLATYRAGGEVRIGVVDTVSSQVFDLASAARRDGAPGVGLRLDAEPHRRG